MDQEQEQDQKIESLHPQTPLPRLKPRVSFKSNLKQFAANAVSESVDIPFSSSFGGNHHGTGTMKRSRSNIGSLSRHQMKVSLSHHNLARFNESLQLDLHPTTSFGNLSQMSQRSLNSAGSPGIPENASRQFITRGELESELNALREEIQKLKQEMEHQELEQKLTLFQLVKKALLAFNLYLSMLTVIQTFQQEYTKLIIESEVEFDNPSTLELLMIMYRATPYILTKANCLKAGKRSVGFLVALLLLGSQRERWRNFGFLISTMYSAFCAWNFKKYSYFKHHVINILMNVLHLFNRYIWLHGLTSFSGMDDL